jgi:hypothetical protein
MDEAIEEWLVAHEGYERFVAAPQNLYAVFARSWQGSRRNLAEAFTDFREAVRKEHEFKHLEVVTVFPRRRPESE